MSALFGNHDYDETLRPSSEKSGGPLRIALVFCALGLGAAVLAAPLMNGIAKYYASNPEYGIDRLTTSSIRRPERYTIRKSVLAPEPQKLCGTGRIRTCDDR